MDVFKYGSNHLPVLVRRMSYRKQHTKNYTKHPRYGGKTTETIH